MGKYDLHLDHLGPPHWRNYRRGCRCTVCLRLHEARRGSERECAKADCTATARKVQGGVFCADHTTARKTAGFGYTQTACDACGVTAPMMVGATFRLCPPCRKGRDALIRRARQHGVSGEVLAKWVVAPSCDGCGRDLYVGKAKGSMMSNAWAIDHDHAHCSGVFGCSECVRGLVCARCNSILGGYEAAVSTFGGRLAGYLSGRPCATPTREAIRV